MFDYDVKVYPINNAQSKVKAFASLIIDNQVEVSGFKIIEGKFGLFVAAPNRPSTKTGDDGKPINYDDVKFIGVKDEKGKNPLQQEIYSLMIERYQGKNATSSRTDAAKAQDGANKQKKPIEDPLW